MICDKMRGNEMKLVMKWNEMSNERNDIGWNDRKWNDQSYCNEMKWNWWVNKKCDETSRKWKWYDVMKYDMRYDRNRIVCNGIEINVMQCNVM